MRFVISIVADFDKNNRNFIKVSLSDTGQGIPRDKLHLVFGVVSDKDISSIADLLPKEATYYFCKPDIPRGKDATELKLTLSEFGIRGEVYNSVIDAYNNAFNNASPNDFIFVGGSTFVVAEII